ncbi:sodium:proton antiporter [Microbacterium sediminicola]|uniref:Sodium:proton antiporter n=1 Tax=Microbacterium sediminicola TaxID=415210 RepID=A0ABN2IH87_9MICO
MSAFEGILFGILGVLIIAATATIAPRLKVAGPLILVGIGILASYLPFIPTVAVNPEWILAGVLPPLLYSAAVSLPAVEFRRDFVPIAGLAVVLVFVSSITLGGFFLIVIPGLGLPLAIALGAILSPTDAVATAVAKRLGVSRRVTTMLEGESLLNDASSLVILKTAVAAFSLSAAGTSTAFSAVGEFAWAVIAAIIVGGLAGFLNLRVRSWLRGSATSTAVGFVVPFVAYIPTEAIGGSGLVAAVVAGIVTGQGAARWFTPEQRMSDHATWRTVELLLEGGVFLVMGLEMSEIVTGTATGQFGLAHGLAVAAAALGILLLVRTGFVTLLLRVQSLRAHPRRRHRLNEFAERIDAHEHTGSRRTGVLRRRLARMFADLDYYRASHLGWKHGTVIVWGGMRGVVTLAAAQTLPEDAPFRHFLIFVAFVVALSSLMLQGLTLPVVVRMLNLRDGEDSHLVGSEHEQIERELDRSVEHALALGSLSRRDGTPFAAEFARRVAPRYLRLSDMDDDEANDIIELRLALVRTRRARLISLSSDGTFGSASLRRALTELDATQLSLEIRLEGSD